MAVKCPQCRTALNPFAIRRRFKCVTCYAQLEGNRTTALIVTVLAWFFLDTVIRLSLYHFFHTVSTQAFVAIGVLVGIILYSVFMDICARVKKAGI